MVAEDILGLWKLAYSNNSSRCATTIQHLTYRRHRKGPIVIQHDQILQDGIRCKNFQPVRNRRFRIFANDRVHYRYANKTKWPRVPRTFLRIMRRSGRNRNIRKAADEMGDPYFVGFEAMKRVCHGSKSLRHHSTAFLMRPLHWDVKVKNVDFVLKREQKWLLMNPLYERVTCVYGSTMGDVGKEEEDDEIAGEESESANGLEGSDKSSSCFPGNARVKLMDGRSLDMESLSVGDMVQVGHGKFSRVFMFTHTVKDVESEFVQIEVNGGNRVTVTGGHYVYANGRLIEGRRIRRGDKMNSGNGEEVIVKGVKRVLERGLFNPQTVHGDIVVDEVVVSTYTESIEPRTAHALLAGFRALFKLFETDFSMGLLDGETCGSAVIWLTSMVSRW